MSFKGLNAKELVEFKGSKRGIIVNIKRKSSFEEIKQSIIERLESSIGFFNGAKICEINCDYLDDIELIKIKDHICSRFDVEFIEKNAQKEKIELRTKYVNNLRSGENVDFDGDIVVMNDMKSGSQLSSTSNVVVMGNIDPGARIVANGNVVVMGRVRGFIHAGANGNKSAYVVANNLNAKILQIANYIAEDPEDYIYEDKSINPEIAFISDGIIIIEGYSNKNLK